MQAKKNGPSIDNTYETKTVIASRDAVRFAPVFSFLSPPRQPGDMGWSGGYRVLRMVGAGGMGAVFEAEDVQLKRRMALKVIKPELAADEAARQRFLREAQTVAALDHDHVVAIFQVGEDRGVLFLAMPFLQGETLDE